MNKEQKNELYKEALRLLDMMEQLLIHAYVQHTIKQAQNDKNK